MKQGYLSQYFTGVAAKTLSAVEADVTISHQHEFNGVSPLKRIFGTEKQTFDTKFLYLNDSDDNDSVIDTGLLTWYDARENHPVRTEFRFYFTANSVMNCASTGDTLLIGRRPDNSVLVIIAEKDTTINNQIKWLFGVESSSNNGFTVRNDLEGEKDHIKYASRFILEQLGIEIEEKEDKYLEDMLSRFGGNFPSTKIFSEYSRKTVNNVSVVEDSLDIVLMNWMEQEEKLFRTLEKHIISKRLDVGFNGDVDGFIKFSLSVQNRRKSRVGQAFENHMEQIFIAHNINYDRTKVTENKSKPDFIFPNISKYHDVKFDVSLLTMLGVKSTCKDRWRQVLSEANRIERKHLITLEAAISENQTNEMIFNKLQLVVPSTLYSTYTEQQQKWLMNVNEFVNLVKERQKLNT